MALLNLENKYYTPIDVVEYMLETIEDVTGKHISEWKNIIERSVSR